MYRRLLIIAFVLLLSWGEVSSADGKERHRREKPKISVSGERFGTTVRWKLDNWRFVIVAIRLFH